MDDLSEASAGVPKTVKRASVLLIVLAVWKLALVAFIVILATARGHGLDDFGWFAVGLLLAFHIPGLFLAIAGSIKLRSGSKAGRVLAFVALALFFVPPDLITLVLLVLVGVALVNHETSDYLRGQSPSPQT